jgi:hypothetical protein
MIEAMKDPASPVPIWRRIALWQLSGLVLATVIFGALSVVQMALSREGLRVQLWPTVFAGNAFWIVSAGVFMMPITVLGLFLWTRAVRRFPDLERGYLPLVLGLLLLALIISLVTGAINNWEVALGQVAGNFWNEAVSGVGYVFFPVVLGLITPRIVLPVLRPGAFVGELRSAAV